MRMLLPAGSLFSLSCTNPVLNRRSSQGQRCYVCKMDIIKRSVSNSALRFQTAAFNSTSLYSLETFLFKFLWRGEGRNKKNKKRKNGF